MMIKFRARRLNGDFVANVEQFPFTHNYCSLRNNNNNNCYHDNNNQDIKRYAQFS